MLRHLVLSKVGVAQVSSSETLIFQRHRLMVAQECVGRKVPIDTGVYNSPYSVRGIYTKLNSTAQVEFLGALEELTQIAIDFRTRGLEYAEKYGKFLRTIKVLLKKELGHGFFEKWFWEWRRSCKFPYSLRTAEKWMSVSELVESERHDALLALQTNVLAEIGSAKPQTRKTLLEKVKAGEIRTLKDVREIKQFAHSESYPVAINEEPTTANVEEILLARYTEIRDAALKAARSEIEQYQEARNALAKQNAILEQQLAELTPQINTLSLVKSKLEQRVQELEFALSSRTTNSWDISGVRTDKKQVLTPFFISNKS